MGADRGNGGSDGDDALGCLDLGARPGVPTHAHAVGAFGVRRGGSAVAGAGDVRGRHCCDLDLCGAERERERERDRF